MDMTIQTELSVPDHPKLQVNKRDSTNEIKSTCAQISSVCGVSVETSRKVNEIVKPSITKTFIFLLKNKLKIREFKLCILYENHSAIIPSVWTITTEYKQLQASDMKKSAAITLYTKPLELKITIHFDSTGPPLLIQNGCLSFLNF